MCKKGNGSMWKKCLTLFLNATIIVGIFYLTACRPDSVKGAVTGIVHIDEDNFHPANYKQFDSVVKLDVSDGRLYMFDNMSGKLYRYESGGFKKLCRFNGSWIGMRNGYFYYRAQSKDTEYSVVGYSLESRAKDEIAKTEISSTNDIFISENGTIHIPTDMDRSSYLSIDNSGILGDTVETESYEIGGYNFMLCGSAQDKYVISLAPDGSIRSYEDELPYGDKVIIPCENGMLIHNSDNGDILYYIECESGRCKELFAVDCIYSRSAVNVRGDQVYLSVVRYTQWGPLSLAGLANENDPINGTYFIDLKDYSVKKLNDNIYLGLFIFDDNGIYACNEDAQVYYLDWDGNIILELTK